MRQKYFQVKKKNLFLMIMKKIKDVTNTIAKGFDWVSFKNTQNIVTSSLRKLKLLLLMHASLHTTS